MSLADRLSDARPAPVSHAGCGAGRLLADLDDVDRDAVMSALDCLPVTQVAREVNDELGVAVAAGTWRRHLAGDCMCDKVGLA